MNPDGGAPAPVDTPAAPVDNAPAPDAPAAPADAPVIPQGTAVTDVDYDAVLGDLDNELDGEGEDDQPPADPAENPDDQPPADPDAKPNGEEEEEEDPNAQPPKPADPPAAPIDTSTPVDIADVESYFNVQEDPAYGIKPVGEIRNPEPGETAQDYYKNVTLPATIQAVQNMVGFQTRNADIANQSQVQQSIEQQNTWAAEYENIAKSGLAPAYKMTADGAAIDPNSEGGKVIGEVLTMMNEHNSKPENAKLQITSLDHAFRSLYQPAQQAKAEADRKAAEQAKRQNANAVLNGGTNGAGAGGRNGQPKAVRKGQSVTDIDYEALLG